MKAIFALAILLAAAQARAAQAPDWVTAGSGAVDDSGRKTFVGVGTVSGNVRRRSVAAAAANLRACSGVANLLNTFVYQIVNDHGVDTTAPGLTAFAKFTLPNLKITGRWRDSSDGSEYSACELELSDLLASVASSTEVTQADRDFVSSDAGPAFERLAAEVRARAPAAPAGGAGHAGPITALAFSRDGSLLLSADDEAAVLWDVRDGRARWTRTSDAGLVGFSADGKFAEAIGWSGLAQEWDAVSGQSRPTGSSAYVAALSKNYAGEGGRQQVSKTVKLFAKNAPHAGLWAECLDKSYLASTTAGEQSSEDEVASFKCRFSASEPGVTRLRNIWAKTTISASGSFSMTDEYAVGEALTRTGGRGGVEISSSGRVSFGGGRAATISGLKSSALSPDGKVLLIGTGGELALWDAEIGVKRSSWSTHAEVTALAFSPDGRTAAVGLGTEADNIRLLRFSQAHGKPVYDGGGKLLPFAPGSSDEDVDSPPAVSSPVDPDAYAVVIGIEKYRQAGIPSVEFAARDAQVVRDYLTKSMGFDAKNVVLLQNEEASQTDLKKYLGTWLRNRVTPKSRVFVYYAGHGAPDAQTGQAYLMPYEGDPAYAEDTAYPIKAMLETLSKLPAKNVLVVLDACFSGQGKRSVAAAGARPLVSVGVPSVSSPNMVVISATGAGQISTYEREAKHGLLTYYLLRGLHGAASDQGQRVTTGRLFSYLQPNVERAARLQNVEQTPTISPAVGELGARADDSWIGR
jgi:hypothetical protein